MAKSCIEFHMTTEVASWERLLQVNQVVSGESPLGHCIYLVVGSPKWVWAAGNDPVAKIGSPWVPCSEEARGERRLHLSGQVVAADSIKSNVNSCTLNEGSAGRPGCFPQQSLLQVLWKPPAAGVGGNNNPSYAFLSYLCRNLGERRMEEAKGIYSVWSPE